MKNTKQIKSSSILVTLSLGLLIGGIGSASFIAIFSKNIPIYIAYMFFGFIFLCSIVFLIYWIMKGQLFLKMTGVHQKEVSNLAEDIFSDLKNKNFKNFDARLLEAIVIWTVYKSRMIFVTTLVFLSTALFLMLNSYATLKQIKLTDIQIKNENTQFENEMILLDKQRNLAKLALITTVKKEINIQNKYFKKLKVSLDSCLPIMKDLKNKNGFSYVIINEYLNYFESFIQFEKDKTITLNELNNLIGIDMLSFYFNKELKEYLNKGRSNDIFGNQWYKGFSDLSKKLLTLDINKKISSNLQRRCIEK